MNETALTAIALDTALERLQAAVQACGTGSTDRLLTALHSAKGLCGQLGEDRLAQQLHQVEGAVLDSSGSPPNAVAGQIARIHEALRRRVTNEGKPTSVSAPALLARVEQDLRQTARRRGVSVHYVAEGGTLDIPGRTAGLLLDLFGHLTRNAIVHGAIDGHVRITIELTADDAGLDAAVRDSGGTGAGSPRAVDRDAGRGLGLVAVRARLDDIGGRCELTRSTDGCTVRIHLPARW